MADNYPSDITLGENYTVFLDVNNHLGNLAYYMVQIEFQNQKLNLPLKHLYHHCTMSQLSYQIMELGSCP
jgi:uncharacterized membrane protein